MVNHVKACILLDRSLPYRLPFQNTKVRSSCCGSAVTNPTSIHGCGPKKKKKVKSTRIHYLGVPMVAQQVKNPASIHEAAGSIPGLAQWIRDPVLLQAAV